jgi:hypothetical protein
MNAELIDSSSAAPSLDEGNPWIGLASFTEETRAYFHGRDEEISELARRVQRKLLTVLFGQSGLGKTSILRAGLVPRLREQGYCPVYVRIDYAREAPEPAEQIKQAIARTARRSGEWTQVGVAQQGESLWEFLHHRDDVLLDDSGKALIPLLIFDQFEEVFTLAQTDEFGRARAARFLADLADLVENRPPRALEEKLEADEATAEKFDFARSDYRVLIALREDYLAPLEGLKGAMPSVTQNRLRLARMTGTQALSAVTRPGKGLVSEEVAAAIVRFVAGGTDVANAEVEPSLLSLICRELNEARIAAGRKEISLDLLAGSHDTILSNFYERALSDQPAAVRRIIEDELLTESGFRENVAEERLKRSLANAGASPDALSMLVNRRLLRIEERLDVRRVELTHDVLCGVVKSSRDVRHEREAREATERQLADQKERERGARRALVRARQIAAICIVLAAGAAIAAIFAYLSTKRAQRAETMAQQSRVQAEQLLGYLTEDFSRELEARGGLQIIADLAAREVDYFRALPEELQGPSTVRTAAIALLQRARALRSLGDLDEATKAIGESEKLLDNLHTKGDDSAATTLALARALAVQSRILGSRGDPSALRTAERAAELIAPLTRDANASEAVRTVEVEVLLQLGVQRYVNSSIIDEQTLAPLQQTTKVAAQLGGRDLTNLYMANRYAEASAWLVQALVPTGRGDDARRIGADGSAVAEKVLALRPNDMNALYAQGLIVSGLTELANDELRPDEARELGQRSEAIQLTLQRLDPANSISVNNLAAARLRTGFANWTLGRFDEGLRYLDRAAENMEQAGKAGAGLLLNKVVFARELGRRRADLGQFDAAGRIVRQMAQDASTLYADEPAGSRAPLWAEAFKVSLEGTIALNRNDAAGAAVTVQPLIAKVEQAGAQSGQNISFQQTALFILYDIKARAEIMLGRYADGEQSARKALEARKAYEESQTVDQNEQADMSTLIALALVAQGRAAEAREIIVPVVKLRRDQESRNHGNNDIKVGLASALYVQALAESKKRAALLRESASTLDSLVPAFNKLISVWAWRQRVDDAIRGVPLPAARSSTN